jgi:hypothetical protein
MVVVNKSEVFHFQVIMECHLMEEVEALFLVKILLSPQAQKKQGLHLVAIISSLLYLYWGWRFFCALHSAEKCLAPVTIKQILGCTQDVADDPIKIDGREASQITFVAQILNVAENSTFVAYTMDDGTGQINVNFWIEQVFLLLRRLIIDNTIGKIQPLEHLEQIQGLGNWGVRRYWIFGAPGWKRAHGVHTNELASRLLCPHRGPGLILSGDVQFLNLICCVPCSGEREQGKI